MKHISKPLIHLLLLGFTFASNTVFACDDSAYRDFDFWLGKWQVTQANGHPAGTNHITKTLNDCVIHEHYVSVNGYEGNSLNIYDQTTGKWHQTWMDNTGLLLQLDGGIVTRSEGENAIKEMAMWGEGLDQSGRTVMHRIIWTPHPDGTVQQRWQVSHDQGINWQMLFDGMYTKEKVEK